MDLDLAEIAHRLKKPTLALETALAHHGLIDSIPPLIHVAIPRGSHRAALKAPVRLHTFAPGNFDIGREVLAIGGDVVVGIYSPVRSIIDMARLRHHEGSDLLWEALRRWLQRPESSPNDLLRMARQFSRAEKPLREALEIIL
jgi:predicted transcriptional regulator of viral defense system